MLSPNAPFLYDPSAETTASVQEADGVDAAAAVGGLPQHEDRIRRVRRLIAQGHYDRPDVVDKAIDRLIDDLTAP